MDYREQMSRYQVPYRRGESPTYRDNFERSREAPGDIGRRSPAYSDRSGYLGYRGDYRTLAPSVRDVEARLGTVDQAALLARYVDLQKQREPRFARYGSSGRLDIGLLAEDYPPLFPTPRYSPSLPRLDSYYLDRAYRTNPRGSPRPEVALGGVRSAPHQPEVDYYMSAYGGSPWPHPRLDRNMSNPYTAKNPVLRPSPMPGRKMYVDPGDLYGQQYGTNPHAVVMDTRYSGRDQPSLVDQMHKGRPIQTAKAEYTPKAREIHAATLDHRHQHREHVKDTRHATRRNSPPVSDNRHAQRAGDGMAPRSADGMVPRMGDGMVPRMGDGMVSRTTVDGMIPRAGDGSGHRNADAVVPQRAVYVNSAPPSRESSTYYDERPVDRAPPSYTSVTNKTPEITALEQNNWIQMTTLSSTSEKQPFITDHSCDWCDRCSQTAPKDALVMDARNLNTLYTAESELVTGQEFIRKTDITKKNGTEEGLYCCCLGIAIICHLGALSCIFGLLWIRYVRREEYIALDVYDVLMGLSGAFGLLAYVGIVAELIFAEPTAFLMNIRNVEDARRNIHNLRHGRPKVIIRVSRLAERRGYRGTTELATVFTEERQMRLPKWRDISREPDWDVAQDWSFIKVYTRTELCFLDQRSVAEYDRIAEELRRKASNIKGVETQLEAVIQVDGISRRVYVRRGANWCTKFFFPYLYWIFSLALLTFPVRFILSRRSKSIHFVLIKAVGK